jgi:serine/threonine protein phosphatase PrpC
VIPRLRSWAATHVGCVRGSNEDFHFNNDELALYVLADGIGGRPNGGEASQLAVRAVVEFMRQHISSDAETNSRMVRQSILYAHDRVLERNHLVASEETMGTTLSVFVVRENIFVAGNVGDSPAFIISRSERGLSLEQVSRTHNVASEMILRGIAPELIRGTDANSLTQAIGITKAIFPHVVSGSWSDFDMAVLCSDGITDYVEDGAFRAELIGGLLHPDLLADNLVRMALERGGGDNCTCICIKSHNIGQ